MKKNQPKIILVILGLLLATWIGRSYFRNLFPTKMNFATTELTTIDDNRKATIGEMKGNVVIVSCYQTWCTDCARETPVLNQLATKLNSEHFKIVYISNEPAAKVNSFRQRFSSDKILFTQCTKSMSELGITVFPTTYLLDKKGKVIMTKLEGYEWLKEEEIIRKLIAE